LTGAQLGAPVKAAPPFNSSKAWRKETPSKRWTNWITLPVAPQLMHRHRPLPGVTRKLGSWSSWNGHSPTKSWPAGLSSTPRARITAARSVVCLIRSISSSGIIGMSDLLSSEPGQD